MAIHFAEKREGKQLCFLCLAVLFKYVGDAMF